MPRVLISGANGFIGKRVIDVLREEGAQIATVGRAPSAGSRHFAFGPAPWTASQWTQVLLATEPEIIFHLAGAQQGDGNVLVQANVELACGLLTALRELNAHPSLVFAGSAAEYGDGVVDGVPIREDIICAPRSHYGKTKLTQTCAALCFAEQTGGRVLVARIFNPIGPDMPAHLALGDFAYQIAAMGNDGGCLITGDIDVARDFLGVEQMAAMLVGLAHNPSATGIVNICSGVPTVVRRLVDVMIARSGKHIDLRVDPARLRPGEPRVLFGSTSRLASFLPPPAEMNAIVTAILADAERRGTGNDHAHMRLMPS